MKTLMSMVFAYGTRGAGLLWTIALIHQLGIGEYGLYSLGFVVAGILGQTLNNPYVVRAARESEDDFVRERVSRYLLGVALMVLGQVFLPINYITWFGIFVAGGELCVGTVKARALRDGDPHVTSRIDTARGVGSVVSGCAYLFGAPLVGLGHPTLLGASMAYCLPYLVMAVLGGFTARGHRPQLPGSARDILILGGEMLGTAAFLGGDVLLLGWLTNTQVVGYYNLTWILASALAYVGQAFGATYSQPLRDSGGDLSTGPPLRLTLTVGLVGGLLVFLVGVGMVFAPVPSQLAIAMLIMSAYCCFRTIIMVFTVVLYAQRRDIVRVSAAIGLLPVKLGLVAALSFMGAIGAAIAASVSDALMLLIFVIALYGKGRHGKPEREAKGSIHVVEGPGD